MSSRRKFLAGCIGALLALAGLMSFASQVEAKDPPQTRVEGKLVTRNLTTRVVTIQKQGGSLVNLTIPTTAKIERNGIKVGLNAFKANDAVQARLLVNGVTVIKFEGVGP